MLNYISLYVYHLEVSLFKEKQPLQSKFGDNIKYFHKYYNWLMYRFLREQCHPHDTKYMSDEMYHGLQQTNNVRAKKFLGPIEKNLIRTPRPANTERVLDTHNWSKGLVT